MRVALLSWESLHALPLGGVSVHVFELAQILASQGHEVHLFTRKGVNQALHDLIGGVYFHRVPLAGEGSFDEQVTRFNRSLRFYLSQTSVGSGHYDIIHAHDWLTYEGGQAYATENGIPLILTFHTLEKHRSQIAHESEQSRRRLNLELSACQHAAAIIAISRCVSTALANEYHVPDWKRRILYHGVHLPTMTPPGAGDISFTDLDPQQPIALFVGRMTESKRPMLFLSALEQAFADCSTLQAALIGGGALSDEVREQVERLRNRGMRCFFSSTLDGKSMQALLQTATMTCIPYIVDLHGIMALQSWRWQTPVVACRDGGAATEFIQDSTNGILVAPQSDSLRDAILRLAQDLDLASWMGQNGRAAVETAFTWRRTAEETVKIYTEALASN